MDNQKDENLHNIDSDSLLNDDVKEVFLLPNKPKIETKHKIIFISFILIFIIFLCYLFFK